MTALPSLKRMEHSFYLLSLGCPKNEVDSECMSALLKDAGHPFTPDADKARYLIVNTCAFIESAVEEAIASILDLADFKARREDARLIVTGCLSQRYKDKIFDEFPEVDAILGTGEYQAITEVVSRLARGEDLRGHKPGAAGNIAYLDQPRTPSSPPGTYAYLKIAEGCSNACAYCAIPRLRGPLRSREPDAIIREARLLADQGFKELILVAQDTTRYGQDLDGQPSLALLLRRLTDEVPGIELFRSLYFYADAITDELIGEMAENPRIARYVDLPIQHASDRVLARMRRHETSAVIEERIEKIREKIPGVIIRTTVMTGFPGESEEDFQELLAFIKRVRFDRLGCFVFSPEEGTPAFGMPDRIPEKTASKRRDLIMQAQQSIARESNRRRIGEVTSVLIEGTEERGILFQGRSYGEAPEIDPAIFIAATSPDVRIGDRQQVRIIDAGPYEMTGVTVDEHCE